MIYRVLQLKSCKVVALLGMILLVAGRAESIAASHRHAQGGPDSFGYRWIDNQGSDNPANGGTGPDFSALWEDLTGSGTQVFGTNVDDAVSSAISLGFSFSFYGTTYTSVYVSSNGNLQFSAPSSLEINVAIPTAAVPNSMIAPFWEDNQTRTGEVRFSMSGTAPNRHFTVHWIDTGHFSSATDVFNYQVQLHENGSVYFLYESMTGTFANGNSATIGIENANGTVGLQYLLNGSPANNALGNGRAIRVFLPPNPPPNAPGSVSQSGIRPESALQALADPSQLLGWTGSQVSFSATVTDPDANQQVRLRVRVKPVTSATWTLLDSGLQAQGMITIPYSIPTTGEFDWEYRVEDVNGASYPGGPVTDPSGWNRAFSNNNSPDFRSDQLTPSAPVAVSPIGSDIDSSGAGGGTVNFSWFPSTDDGPATALRYEIQVSPGSLFTDIEAAASNLATTSIGLDVGVSGLPKYWRVRSTDIVGRVSEWSNVRSFRLVFDDGIDHAAGDAEKFCGFSTSGSGGSGLGLLFVALAVLAVLTLRR